jgi:hypothetical protein
MGILKALRYFLKDIGSAQCTGHHRVTNKFKKDEEGNYWVLPTCTDCGKEVGAATPVLQE